MVLVYNPSYQKFMGGGGGKQGESIGKGMNKKGWTTQLSHREGA